MSELTDLLRELPVPDHGPGFWADLEAQLADTTSPVEDGLRTISRIGDIDTDVEFDDAAAELGPRRARRWMLAAATAAAAIAIVIGLSTIGDDDSSPVITDITPTTTAPTTITGPPPEEETAPDALDPGGNDIVWTTAQTNLGPQQSGSVVFGAGAFYTLALYNFPSAPLLRSDDGVVWEPVAESAMRVGDSTPSWFPTEPAPTGFEVVAWAATDTSLHIIEASYATSCACGEAEPLHLRIWTNDGTVWSLVHHPLAPEPVPGVNVNFPPSQGPLFVSAAASPNTLVVSVQPLTYRVNWEQFYDLGAWDPDGKIAESFGILGPPIQTPGPDGITIENVPTDPSINVPPFVAWEDLAPAARDTYDWLLAAGDGQSAAFVINANGNITPVDGPFQGEHPTVTWTGTQFTTINEDGIYFSTDGMTWERGADPLPHLPTDASGLAVLDDAIIAWWYDGQMELSVSTDLGATFAPVELGSGEWDLIAYSNSHGVFTVLISRGVGDLTYISTTNGRDWNIRPIDIADNRNPTSDIQRGIAELADGTIYFFGAGRVDIGRPAS